ncbi:MAG: hypothetical protein J6S28_11185 [Clostridia bacterium]|nr:hypothetical protein [Clostridia bacterium]
MKKLLSLLLCMLLLASVLSACNTQTPPVPEDTTQTESQGASDATPTIPPEQALPPEQVVQGLDADAVIMEIGTKTRQVLLNNDWAEIKDAFTAAGYAPIEVTLLDNAKMETVVLYGNTSMVTLQNTAGGAYAIWEPYNQATLSVLTPNEKTGTGEVTLAQIGIARIEETDNPINGMCYIYKLSDGSAVIIDGGFNNKDCRNNILNTLDKLDIAKNADGKYLITAWIFSHGHKDHRAAFTGFGKNMGDQVELTYAMYSFPPSPGTLTASTFDSVNFENKMYEYYPGVQHIVPHAGLAYHFDNLTVKILYAPEMMYAPDKTIAYYNDTSLIMLAECGSTGALFMGDAGEAAAALTWDNYEKAAFEAEMLQVTHHGFNTGDGSHNWKNIKLIYTNTKASYGLIPMGSRLEGDARNGRHTVIVGHGGANYQMSFFIDKTDRHDQGSTISQEYYNKFVDEVAAGTAKYETLFGYDGINKLVSNKGLISYTSGNEKEPMVTLFTLSESGVSVAHNQVLSEWLAD